MTTAEVNNNSVSVANGTEDVRGRGVDHGPTTRSRSRAMETHSEAEHDCPEQQSSHSETSLGTIEMEDLLRRVRTLEDRADASDGRMEDLEQEIQATGDGAKELLDGLDRKLESEVRAMLRDMLTERERRDAEIRVIQEEHERVVTELRRMIDDLKLECRTHRARDSRTPRGGTDTPYREGGEDLSTQQI